ncbi:1-deoxy-D-xylulose-5-phosphate reductoisomerase [Desulfobacterales bacterium HSG16]|nr:1-deoxy-D-xylulose-5-phosphate reductoisomerase [Desulfobacterales bacterium HSG16]
MKNLCVLGSTGSIGCNTLEIAQKFPDRFSVKVLAAGQNISLLADQIEKFQPQMAVVLNEKLAENLEGLLKSKGLKDKKTKILYGEEGYLAGVTHDQVHMVVTAVVGAAGLLPTLAAIDAKKDIALANKETLVMAGNIVMSRAAEKGVKILPVDSEHSAIFQSLAGQRRQDLDKIFLTASGGPFLNRKKEDFGNIQPEDALAHPTWSMGKKISIDSSTLMNKGLEVIEAMHLFNLSPDQIEVVVHPQSIVHSMVGYKDGSVIAQLGTPDMKGAIAYALSWPERLSTGMPFPDFAGIKNLSFQSPDFDLFPCLSLAFDACHAGNSTLPAVLNAANEEVVWTFLDKCIPYKKIPEIIKLAMKNHEIILNPAIDDILDADQWARQFVKKEIDAS